MNNPVSMNEFRSSARLAGRNSGGNMFAVLDLGSSKLACAIAEFQNNETSLAAISIKGFGHYPSSGIRAGQIIDMDAAEKSIREAVYAAERMGGVNLSTVVLGVPPAGVKSMIHNAEISLGGHPVSDEHLHQCMSAACRQHSFEDGEIIHAVPSIYALDDNKYVIDPRGMYAEKLRVTMHIVSIPHMLIRNLRTCLERCYLEDERLVVTPFASALASLNEEQMMLGALHIDMGASMCSYTIFYRRVPIHIGMVPVGGMHLTQDIAQGLGVSLTTAEKMKTIHGSALPGGHEQFRFPAADGAHREYSHSQLRKIIAPRLEETFQYIDHQLTQSQLKKYSGARAFITGGASELPGAVEIAQDVLGMEVHKIVPHMLSNMPAIAAGGGFSAVSGLIRYICRANSDALYAQEPPTPWRARFNHWFRKIIA